MVLSGPREFLRRGGAKIAPLILGPASSPLRPDGSRISRLYYRTAPGSGYTAHWPGISAATGAGDAPSPSTTAATQPPGDDPRNASPGKFLAFGNTPSPGSPGQTDRWGISRGNSTGNTFPANCTPREISREMRHPGIPRISRETAAEAKKVGAAGRGIDGRFLPSRYPAKWNIAFQMPGL